MKTVYELMEDLTNKPTSVIKSIQSGVANIATANTPVNVTIGDVDMNKAIVLPRSNRNASDYLALTSRTVLEVKSTAVGSVGWQVIEFY